MICHFILFILTAPLTHAYEHCTKSNGYFEKLLPSADIRKIDGVCLPNTKKHRTGDFAHLDRLCKHLQLPAACVFEAMKRSSRLSASYNYIRCNGDRSGIDHTGYTRPCLSQKYHFAAYSAFVNSMSCLGLDAKEVFPLINHESHFHLNVRSGTGALGVGQLTTCAVTEVNQRRTLEALKAVGRCESLAHALETPMTDENGCHRVLPPGNPARNFLYAGATYQYCKERANELSHSLLLLSKIPESWKTQITIDLARWMYNGGIEGVSTVLYAFAKEPANAQGFTDYSQFRGGFQEYLKANYGRSIAKFGGAAPERRREVSGYVNAIINDVNDIEDSVEGLRCTND